MAATSLEAASLEAAADRTLVAASLAADRTLVVASLAVDRTLAVASLAVASLADHMAINTFSFYFIYYKLSILKIF